MMEYGLISYTTLLSRFRSLELLYLQSNMDCDHSYEDVLDEMEAEICERDVLASSIVGDYI